jgi:hypothetical protein
VTLAAVVVLLAHDARATPRDLFGMGARPIARAGAGVAQSEGVDSVLTNPAGLATAAGGTTTLGALGTGAWFEDLPGVAWDTNRDGRIDAQDPALVVDPDEGAMGGIVLGATRPLGARAFVGAVAYLPGRLARVATFEPSLPAYPLIANRLGRYEAAVGGCWTPGAGVSLGVAARILPRAEVRIDGTLSALVEDPSGGTEPSDALSLAMDLHRVQLDIVPSAVPVFGVRWDAGAAVPALDGLAIGAAWQGAGGLAVDGTIDLQVDAGTGALGDLSGLRVPLAATLPLSLTDHYVPAQWNVGARWRIARTLDVMAEVRHTAWSALRPSVAHVSGGQLRTLGATVDDDALADGNLLAARFRDTIAPRVAVDLRLPRLPSTRLGTLRPTVSGGFGLEPGALEAQSDDTVLLDGTRRVYALGAGLERRRGDSRTRWDAFVQLQSLRGDPRARPDPGAPTAGYPTDGSPLPVGGTLVAGGLQWSTATP